MAKLTYKSFKDQSTWTVLKRSLFTGTLVIGPVVLTAYLLWKIFLFADGILSAGVKAILVYALGISFLKDHSIPGLGFVALLALLTVGGFAARNVVGHWTIIRIQRAIDQIPLVNRIYKAVQQISNAIFSGRQEVFGSAVLIEYPRKGVYCIAITTSDNGGLIKDDLPEECISVFLPSTPNPTSGFLLFLPKKEVIELDISVEDALKLIISGGTIKEMNHNNIDQ